MTLHLQKGLDLGQRQILPVTQCHQLVESAKQLKRISQNLPLIQALANAGGHLGKQMQTVNILEDVGLAVGDQDNVQFIQRLVHEAHIVLLHGSVLSSRVGEFGEGGKQGFNS